MTTAWTETASEICTDALEHLGVIGDGETPSSGDMQTALRGLDAVLKELPLVGYSWPKMSGELALTWVGIQTIALPADYYGYPVAWKTLNGFKSPLSQISHAQWVVMPNRTGDGETTHFYIDQAKVLHFWPNPPADPVVTLQYQKIVDDAALVSAPDLPQYWIGALGFGVANEVALKFGVPRDKRMDISQIWDVKRSRALSSSVASEIISFSVAE
jgi:hypothetical protein